MTPSPLIPSAMLQYRADLNHMCMCIKCMENHQEFSMNRQCTLCDGVVVILEPNNARIA